MKKWLVLYDIANPKRLRRVAKTLEKYGRRVQYSCFEIKASEKLIAYIKEVVKSIINPTEDGVAWIFLCEKDWKKREYFPKDIRKQKKEESDYKIL